MLEYAASDGEWLSRPSRSTPENSLIIHTDLRERKLENWAIIVSTLVGPVLAVIVSRIMDESAQKMDRRNRIFAGFLTSRSKNITPAFVDAMNQIDIEFKDIPKILERRNALMMHYRKPMPSEENRADLQYYLDERINLQIDLAIELGKVVNVRVDRHDYKESGYYPDYYYYSDIEAREIRKSLLDLLQNKSAVRVAVDEVHSNDSTQ